jgi:undecaprenyl-diphosphatase
MIFSAILLSLIEGITEFLPVSSTGHLILLGDILNFEGPPGKAFEIIIQLGAILAICCLYHRKLTGIAKGVVKRNPADIRFATGVLVAFLPAMVIGAASHEFIKRELFNPVTVSIALIVGGIAILLIERFKPAPRIHTLDSFSLPLCLKIGFLQCLALIPGTSRSGATIMGSLLLGVERKAATEFSFLLAIPTMFAATVFDLYKNWNDLNAGSLLLIAMGFGIAFITALVVVRVLIAYITDHGFAPFAWYRIVLGSAMLLYLWH